MARGRLQYAFLAGLRQLDTEATATAGSMDDEFREVKRVADGSWEGASGRQEGAEVRVRCQVEDGEFERLDPMTGGFEHQGKLALVCHFRDLERAGLVEAATGVATLRATCRLTAIYDLHGNIQQAMPGQGLHCTEARPLSYGLGMKLNLLLLVFEDRDQTAKG
jgi:hypothetical protein